MPEDSLWRLTPENLKKQYPLLKSFEKTHFGNFPAIKAVIDDSAYYFAGNLPYPQMMEIPISAIEERVKSICGDSLEYTIEKSDRFTQYYMPRLRGQANLPVYEVKIADSCHSTIYIDPSDGYLRYITDHKRIRKWLFEGLHYWNINGLYTLKPLWTILIWGACMSCMVVCITGVIVTCSKVGRSFRKVKHLST